MVKDYIEKHQAELDNELSEINGMSEEVQRITTIEKMCEYWVCICNVGLLNSYITISLNCFSIQCSIYAAWYDIVCTQLWAEKIVGVENKILIQKDLSTKKYSSALIFANWGS